jgi:hypothetical protein
MAIFNSPGWRYSSDQKKRLFKFPIRIFNPWMGAKPWWIPRPFGGSWTVPN